MNENVELKGNFFQQSNSLIFRSKPSHFISHLSTPQKNIELKVIAVSRQGSFRTKRGEITQFLVADQTGSSYMNFFDQTGALIQEGDILYISGAYTSYYKERLVIYQGSCSVVRRIGKKYMKFDISPGKNISLTKGPNMKEEQK